MKDRGREGSRYNFAHGVVGEWWWWDRVLTKPYPGHRGRARTLFAWWAGRVVPVPGKAWLARNVVVAQGYAVTVNQAGRRARASLSKSRKKHGFK